MYVKAAFEGLKIVVNSTAEWQGRGPGARAAYHIPKYITCKGMGETIRVKELETSGGKRVL